MVFELKCSGCVSYYVGQTSRHDDTRISEIQQSIHRCVNSLVKVVVQPVAINETLRMPTPKKSRLSTVCTSASCFIDQKILCLVTQNWQSSSHRVYLGLGKNFERSQKYKTTFVITLSMTNMENIWFKRLWLLPVLFKLMSHTILKSFSFHFLTFCNVVLKWRWKWRSKLIFSEIRFHFKLTNQFPVLSPPMKTYISRPWKKASWRKLWRPMKGPSIDWKVLCIFFIWFYWRLLCLRAMYETIRKFWINSFSQSKGNCVI